jgi:ABC-type lipopolysaccharide export system ATPase subunit
VETILKDIGINVEDSDDKNRVDKIIYIDPKIKSVIEIKGRLTKSASEKDCSQLEKWKMEEMTKLGYEPKGILVMNAFAEIDPVKRQDYFPNQMIAFAKKKELSLVSSDCLLKMYIDFKHGKITGEEIYNDLVTNIGVLDYKPFN